MRERESMRERKRVGGKGGKERGRRKEEGGGRKREGGRKGGRAERVRGLGEGASVYSGELEARGLHSNIPG